MATRTVPPSGENDTALSMRLLNTCASRLSWPMTIGGEAAAALLQHHVDARGAGAMSFWIETMASASFSTSTALGALARQFGIEPAGIGDVGDQPVEPAHVVLDDGVEPLAVLGALGQRQRLDGASAARSAGS